MRRAFVAHDHAAGAFGLAAGFAFEQKRDAAGQEGDFLILTGDHVAEVFDGADQVGDLFFKFFHAAWLAPGRGRVKRRGVPIARSGVGVLGLVEEDRI